MITTRHNVMALSSLMALLVVTVAVAYVDLGVFHTAAAMLIALAKAVIIVLVFMRLRLSDALARLAFVGGLFWLAIMFVLTLSDYFTR